jgi:hypothetical protein
MRLAGGSEVTVYELVAWAAGVEVPNTKMDPSEANATLKRYGMKVIAGKPVETGKWLIENNSHKVTRMMSYTPFSADWRGRLLRLDGAEKGNSERFRGLPLRRVSLPLSVVLAEAPPSAPAEDDLPP